MPDSLNLKTVTFSLDGKYVTVPEGTTIWEAANAKGTLIPHLCHKPSTGYRADGNCRACMVEIEGERVLAAAAAAEDVTSRLPSTSCSEAPEVASKAAARAAALWTISSSLLAAAALPAALRSRRAARRASFCASLRASSRSLCASMDLSSCSLKGKRLGIPGSLRSFFFVPIPEVLFFLANRRCLR